MQHYDGPAFFKNSNSAASATPHPAQSQAESLAATPFSQRTREFRQSFSEIRRRTRTFHPTLVPPQQRRRPQPQVNYALLVRQLTANAAARIVYAQPDALGPVVDLSTPAAVARALSQTTVGSESAAASEVAAAVSEVAVASEVAAAVSASVATSEVASEENATAATSEFGSEESESAATNEFGSAVSESAAASEVAAAVSEPAAASEFGSEESSLAAASEFGSAASASAVASEEVAAVSALAVASEVAAVSEFASAVSEPAAASEFGSAASESAAASEVAVEESTTAAVSEVAVAPRESAAASEEVAAVSALAVASEVAATSEFGSAVSESAATSEAAVAAAVSEFDSEASESAATNEFGSAVSESAAVSEVAAVSEFASAVSEPAAASEFGSAASESAAASEVASAVSESAAVNEFGSAASASAAVSEVASAASATAAAEFGSEESGLAAASEVAAVSEAAAASESAAASEVAVEESTTAAVSEVAVAPRESAAASEPASDATTTAASVTPYQFPPLTLLPDPVTEDDERMDEWVLSQSNRLDEALSSFSVDAHVANWTVGPTVTQFEITLGRGVKVSKITNLTDDLKLALAARDIRIEAPIPGKSSVGVEIPNLKSRPVMLAEVLQSPAFQEAKSPLTVALGVDLFGKPQVTDLKKMPHGLIAGATGSGKSVFLNSMLVSLLYKATPQQLKLLLIDPKAVEMAPYQDIPHLLAPVISDPQAAAAALKWVVDEMEKRYQRLAAAGARNIEAFNHKAQAAGQYGLQMPYIVVVIDELADLMMVAASEVQDYIARITQKARAAGIHLIVATQRPSVDVVTGTIKNNIPTRIAFMVASQVDSRTILDTAGAERLLGRGDMLYLGNGSGQPRRLQGTFIEETVDQVTDFVRQQARPNYAFDPDGLKKKVSESQSHDDLLPTVLDYIVNEEHISTSKLQRVFSIGYNRAANLIDDLEAHQYISPARGSKPREVYLTQEELNKLRS